MKPDLNRLLATVPKASLSTSVELATDTVLGTVGLELLVMDHEDAPRVEDMEGLWSTRIQAAASEVKDTTFRGSARELLTMLLQRAEKDQEVDAPWAWWPRSLVLTRPTTGARVRVTYQLQLDVPDEDGEPDGQPG